MNETSTLDCNPLIIDATNTQPIVRPTPLFIVKKGSIEVDWKNLADHRSKAHESNVWLPSEIPIPPLPFPTNVDKELYPDLWRRLDPIGSAQAREEKEATFYRYTMTPMLMHMPNLAVLMSEEPVSLMSDSHYLMLRYSDALFFVVGLNRIGPFNTTEVAIHNAGSHFEQECKEHTRALVRNLFGSGMMQNYFTDLQPEAPQLLCAIMSQYTLRLIQAHERLLLRLLPFGLTEETKQILESPWTFLTDAE